MNTPNKVFELYPAHSPPCIPSSALICLDRFSFDVSKMTKYKCKKHQLDDLTNWSAIFSLLKGGMAAGY